MLGFFFLPQVTVQLTDANDNRPEFENSFYRFSVNEEESNATVGMVTAVDSDSGMHTYIHTYIHTTCYLRTYAHTYTHTSISYNPQTEQHERANAALSVDCN